MTTRGSAVLYTPEILALAVELAEFPLEKVCSRRGEAHSRVCGSHVVMGIEPDETGRVAMIGARVSACAIGQAAAALFLRSAVGRGAEEIADALSEVERWLARGESEPDWPGIAALAPARAYPARHPAILLPWKAALVALSNHDTED